MTENILHGNSTKPFLPKILWDERCLVVSPGLVMALASDNDNAGNALTDAFLLQQAHYWMGKAGGAIIDGLKWFYNTYQEWQDQLPFFSVSTIRRAIARLKSRNLILVERYSDENCNQINWYSVNYGALKDLWLAKYSEWTPETNRHERFRPAILNRSSVNTKISTENSSNISLPLPPQEPPALEKEREPEPNLENPDLVDWDAIKTQISQDHQRSLDEYNSAPPLTANQETFIPTEDPWLDSPSEPLLNNDLTIQPDAYEVVVVEERRWEVVQVPELEPEVVPHPQFCADGEAAVVQVPELEPEVVDQVPQAEAGVPKLESNPGVGFAAPVLKQVPKKQETQKDWEIAPGVPYPAFVKWRSQHYIKQGGHWADAAQANAKSEIRNNPKRAQDLWEQFLEYSNTATDTALARQAVGMAPVLPACFDDAKPATKEGVVGKLDALAGIAQVALPQGIATPSCTATIPWMPKDEAVEKVQSQEQVKPIALAGITLDPTPTTNNAPGGENADAYTVFKADALPEPTLPPEDIKAKIQELLAAKSMPKSKYQEPRNKIEECRNLIASGNSELIAQAGRRLDGMGAKLVRDNNGEVCGFEI